MVLVLFVLSVALWQLAAGVFMFCPVCCLCLAFDHYFWEEGAGWFHWLVKCVLILLTAHCKISYIHYAKNAIAGSLEADFQQLPLSQNLCFVILSNSSYSIKWAEKIKIKLIFKHSKNVSLLIIKSA